MDEPEMTVRKVPVFDTGIGREAGYRNDQELIAVAGARRAALPQRVRDLLDEAEAEFQRRVLGSR